MGNLCNASGTYDAEEAEKNRRIQERLGEDQKSQDAVHKMLLLGAGESGKSTLFKQMNMIYGKDPFPEEERLPYAQVIFANVIDSIKTLIDMAEVHAPDMPFQVQILERVYLK